jgi:hypothetical protein
MLCQALAPSLPRLLVAFSEQCERYATADEIKKYAAIAPVTERSGDTSLVHWRLHCPMFLPNRVRTDTGGEFENAWEASFPQGTDALKS